MTLTDKQVQAIVDRIAPSLEHLNNPQRIGDVIRIAAATFEELQSSSSGK